MKRKIFSKFLMVALVIAAVGSFVSCKDYDDDINNLQKQIDAKAAISELTALQSTLESKISAAQSAATAAQAKADAAATKTSVDELKKALETAIADAKKAGTDAGTKAGEAITAANKAQETADAAAAAAKKADEDAKAALADALKTIEETYQTKADAEKAVEGLNEAIAAVKETADAAFTKAEAEKLQEQVDGLKAELEAAIDEKIDAKIQEVNNAVASVDAIWKAVTSIELYPTLTGAATGQKTTLLLYKGKEVDNDFGGAAGSKASKLQILYQDGAALEGDYNTPISYVKDQEISFDNRVIVRVNPTNAVLNKEDIVIINSLGNTDLSDLVEVKEIKDYNRLITTRGENVATGLKVINIARKTGVTDAQIAAATKGAVIDGTKVKSPQTGKAYFALGLKNGENDRVLYTTFDLLVNYGDYVPQLNLDFYVKGDKDEAETKSSELHNRWSADNKLIGEDETKESPKAPYVNGWYPEFIWETADAKKGIVTPAVDTLWVSADGKTKNFKTGDVRYGKKTYVVADGSTRSFTIYPKNVLNADAAANSWHNVQYYYVTLDKCAAVESAPSEYQSWKKYTYEGLYTITPATDNLTITVTDAAAEGDIIGFRVFAVNYDGTLVDPDGKSFYVQIGEPAAPSTTSLAGHFTAVVNNAAGLETNLANALAELAKGDDQRTKNVGIYEAKFAKAGTLYNHATGAAANFSGAVSFSYANLGEFKADANHTLYATFAGTTDASAPTAGYGRVTGQYWLLKSDKKNLATNVSEVAYILTSVDYAGQWRNGATAEVLKFDVKDPDHHNNVVETVSLTLTKDMPTAPSFKWNATREPVGNVLTVYPEPATAAGAAVAWNTIPSGVTGGRFNIAQYSNITAANYSFKVTKAPKTGTTPVNVIAQQAANAYAFFTRVDTDPNKNAGEAIMNTEYDAALTYTFAGINTTIKDDGSFDKTEAAYDAAVASANFNKIKFVDALDPAIQVYSWKTYNFTVGNAYNTLAAKLDVVKSSSEFFIVWGENKLSMYSSSLGSDGGGAHAADARMAEKKAVAVDIWTLLQSNNSANMSDGAKLFTQMNLTFADPQAWYYNASGFTDFGGSAFGVRIISGGTEYYTGRLRSSNGQLDDGTTPNQLKPAAVVPPAAKLNGTLEIYVVDAFGLNWNQSTATLSDAANRKSIASLPVVLYPNETAVEYTK